jgi:hypothetical protein
MKSTDDYRTSHVSPPNTSSEILKIQDSTEIEPSSPSLNEDERYQLKQNY